MKQIKYAAILALVGLATGSCKKDFLTVYPEGNINEGNFYKTAADFQQALTGSYVPLRDVANVAFWMDEMRTDNTEYDYNTQDRGGLGYEQIADFLDDASNGVTSTPWTADFKGIQRTDVILDRIQSIASSVISDSAKNQLIGETKALRAHYYFDLVRRYGKVPLYLHEVKENTGAFISRSSVDSIYGQIIADFSDALTLLKPPASFPQSGRITKGMVATELGLVYLTRKDYPKAADLFQTVTQMGYALLPQYADVFATANKNSRESIFEVQYKTGTDGQASWFIYRFIPVTPNTGNILGPSFVNGYGGWNVPTDDLLSAYEASDKRLDASVAVAEGKKNANLDFLPDSVVSILKTTTPGEIAKRFVKKQWHTPFNGSSTLIYNTDDNWPLYRYADVLLMLAEALNEQGKSGDALLYLNQVRTRAGLAASAETDQNLLREVIAHERRIELAFENHRWFDLVRTEQAIPVMTAFGILQKQKYPYILPNAYIVNQNRLIYPVPFRETQVNPALGQNPGYGAQ
ncbi:RagB/SusD family nutrient uptake outer membrane protein [Flavitalea flava]